ncbi:Cytochrome P450 [Elaphomyces granulatus]
MTASSYTPIPSPRGIPFLGNIYDIDSSFPFYSIEQLAEQYGPIYRLTAFGTSTVYISSHDLVDEACNESRFQKALSGFLKELRNCVHDGLFTAEYPGDENWAIAHRILVPILGPLSVHKMFDDMYDIATQLVMKWARQGPKVPIAVAEDFTRLTLDTLVLCTMGTRFNSFYLEHMHPFTGAMGGWLKASADRSLRPALLNYLPFSENGKYWKHIAHIKKVAEDLINNRRENPEDRKDLLNALISGKDPKTREGLSDESTLDNLITFLTAGHETTARLLSFIFYFLLKNPSAYKKAQEEVDTVVGRRKISIEDLPKLPYINAVLRETLRLKPSVVLMSLKPNPQNCEDPVTLGNGKYALRKGDTIAILLTRLHRDPEVYGPDAEEFKPERMLDENFEKLPNNAWKPFGNGMRACIGRSFSWQEAMITVTMSLQNFNFQLDDPGYTLDVNKTRTVKPMDFRMRAILRDGIKASTLGAVLNRSEATVDVSRETIRAGEEDSVSKVRDRGLSKRVSIFFGSNMGTCEAFSRRLADDAGRHGYVAEIDSLDSAVQKIPKSNPVIFITSSYEGQPPDNAAHFFEWLSGLKSNELEGVSYAVFGCGHHDWQATFHKVPKIVDCLLGEHGATRLCEIGLADAANSDMFTDFDHWCESGFWPAIFSNFGGQPKSVSQPKSALQVEVASNMRAATLGLQLQEGLVVQNRLLTQPDVPAKRLVRFKLQPDTTYRCGDYLTILPINPSDVVRRAIRRFGLPWDAVLQIRRPEGSNPPPTIPLDRPVSAFDLFSTYVELSQPASKRDLNVLAEAASPDSGAQAELHSLASSPTRFTNEIINSRVSPLDLLWRYPAINLPIDDFLMMLPPMRMRQYSISSSPLVNPSECTITFSVLNVPALPGPSSNNEQRDEERLMGVASTYLSNLKPGDRAHISIRPSKSGFKPPIELKTPMVMACAGSGLAPFRSFIMERAEKIRGRHASFSKDKVPANIEKPAKAILYVGCRTKGKDDIHATELAEWERLGAVDVRWAYSRPEDGRRGQHIQDLMLADKKEVAKLIKSDARIYICGSTGVANTVRSAFKEIYLAQRREAFLGESWEDIEDKDTAAEKFFERLKAQHRFATDVFT